MLVLPSSSLSSFLLRVLLNFGLKVIRSDDESVTLTSASKGCVSSNIAIVDDESFIELFVGEESDKSL